MCETNSQKELAKAEVKMAKLEELIWRLKKSKDGKITLTEVTKMLEMNRQDSLNLMDAYEDSNNCLARRRNPVSNKGRNHHYPKWSWVGVDWKAEMDFLREMRLVIVCRIPFEVEAVLLLQPLREVGRAICNRQLPARGRRGHANHRYEKGLTMFTVWLDLQY